MLYRFHPPTDELAVISFEIDNFESAIEEVNRSLVDPETVLIACPDGETSDLVGMELREDPDKKGSYFVSNILHFRIVKVSEIN